MNPLRWPFRAQFLLGFLICAAVLGYAIFLQLEMGLEPCPLCIFQRIAFFALGLLFLIGALHGPPQRAGRATYGLLAFVAAVVGIGIAARHVYVQMLPDDMGISCGPPMSFLRETQGTLDIIRIVLTGTGKCGTIDWTFLGLTMPMWSLVWFVILGAWALYASLKRRGR